MQSVGIFVFLMFMANSTAGAKQISLEKVNELLDRVRIPSACRLAHSHEKQERAFLSEQQVESLTLTLDCGTGAVEAKFFNVTSNSELSVAADGSLVETIRILQEVGPLENNKYPFHEFLLVHDGKGSARTVSLAHYRPGSMPFVGFAEFVVKRKASWPSK